MKLNLLCYHKNRNFVCKGVNGVIKTQGTKISTDEYKSLSAGKRDDFDYGRGSG